MRAILYDETGGPEVLHLVERERPMPGPGEVLVRVHVSGVNPTDWKTRAGITPSPRTGDKVPHHDGAGEITAVGEGVGASRVGERVWTWEAATGRDGTAQEYAVVPADRAVALGDASYDVGAALGVPALTAHRTLTVAEGGPTRLAPGALAGWTVLVAGGAGAVGHAAVQLARWAGATVLTTVSSPQKAALAQAAGAHHVVDYRAVDAAAALRALAPGGVDLVVEVSPAVNARMDLEVCRNGATISYYATNGGEEFTLPVRGSMSKNLRWQGVLLYGVPGPAKADAVAAVTAAAADGALPVGEQAGLPLHRFPLERTADAHRAVESGVVGKVLVDVG